MDHFGIGTALQALARAYFGQARGTRRTTSLLDSVKAGDRIIVADPREQARLLRLLEERTLDPDRARAHGVDVRVVRPDQPGRLFDMGTPTGRTLFEHTWVEQFYTRAIDAAAREIDELQTQASGYGEAHRETRRRFDGDRP